MRRGLRSAILAGLLLLSPGCGRERRQAESNQVTSTPSADSQDSGGPAQQSVPARRPSRIEARLVPPGSAIGSDPDPQSPSIVFLSPRPPARLLDWVRATANSEDFILDAEMEEGAEHVFNGRMRESDQGFTVRLAPGANGGTTGVVLVTPRR
jgi:hypothetical protein